MCALPIGLPSDTGWSLAFDSNCTLWIGTLAGLAKFQDGRIERVAMPVEGTPRLYSTVLVGDDLWVGTAQGVYVRAPDGRWSKPEWTPMFERPNALLQIARDDDGAYWLGRGRKRVVEGKRG